MAGTMKVFNELTLALGKKYHDFSADTLSVILIQEAVGTIETTSTPDQTDFTEIANGGGYTTGGYEIATPTWLHAAGVSKLDHNAGEPFVLWTSTGSGGSALIKTALLVNDAAAAVFDCIAFLDMTSDGGTTPVNLNSGDVKITWGAGGILTLSEANP